MADEWTEYRLGEGKTLAERRANRREIVHKGRGLFKYVRKPGHWYDADGKQLKSKMAEASYFLPDEPNEYIGICDWVESEKERYEHAMEAMRATNDEWAPVMDRIFAETSQEWLELGKQQKTFSKACRSRMLDAGVPEWKVDIALPPQI
jgi:hypothetical protein